MSKMVDNPMWEFHNVYVQYKQDTRAVVAWLVNHGGLGSCECSSALSIRSLYALTERIIRREIRLPETIDFLFREAIRARTLLSRIFRTRSANFCDEETINHEHFTSSLSDIHAKLRKFTRGTNERHLDGSPCCTCKVEESVSRNRFDPLEAACTNQDETSATGSQICGAIAEEAAREAHTATSSGQPAPFLEDALGQACELQAASREMHELQCAAIDVWKQAARGSCSILIAAFITHLIVAEFEDIEQRLKTICRLSDPTIFYERLKRCVRHDLLDIESDDPNANAIKGVETILRPWDRLLITSKPTASPCQSTTRPRIETDVVLRPGNVSAAEVDAFLDIMLQDIQQHIRQTCSCSTIVRTGSPILAEVGYFLTHDQVDSNGLRCSFGLQLLHEGCRTYFLESYPRRASSGCRLAALKFAQEAISSVNAVLWDKTMPCRCQGTLAYHLENLHKDLDVFLHSRSFDLYFQSPWVSGSHILEIHDALFYYGLCLFKYRNYVGAVIHVYNVLRELSDLKALPLLETLRELFKHEWFPGGQRPDRNFKNCYVRYLGGRLKFRSAHRTNHQKGCHSMVVPAHAARTSAGFGMRKQDGDEMMRKQRVSLLHRIKNLSYYVDEETWKEIFVKADEARKDNLRDKDPPSAENLHASKHGGFKRTHHHTGPCIRLQELQKALAAETRGPFPVLRINFFRIYLACAALVGNLSGHWHQNPTKSGHHCLCFVDTMLAAADQVRDEERSWQSMGCKELQESCQKGFEEGCVRRELGDFLWKES